MLPADKFQEREQQDFSIFVNTELTSCRSSPVSLAAKQESASRRAWSFTASQRDTTSDHSVGWYTVHTAGYIACEMKLHILRLC